MRSLLGWILALGLIASPAIAGTDTAAGNTPATTKTDASAAPPNSSTPPAPKDPSVQPAAKPAASSLESELAEMRDLLESQSRQLDIQGEQLKQQQQKMAALEERLKAANPAAGSSSASPAPNVDVAVGADAGANAALAANASSTANVSATQSSGRPRRGSRSRPLRLPQMPSRSRASPQGAGAPSITSPTPHRQRLHHAHRIHGFHRRIPQSQRGWRHRIELRRHSLRVPHLGDRRQPLEPRERRSPQHAELAYRHSA